MCEVRPCCENVYACVYVCAMMWMPLSYCANAQYELAPLHPWVHACVYWCRLQRVITFIMKLRVSLEAIIGELMWRMTSSSQQLARLLTSRR